MVVRRGAMDAWDPWLGRIARRARRGKAWKRHGTAWAWHGMAWHARHGHGRGQAQQPNLAGPDDPAWRSRNTGDGQEGGGEGKRARENRKEYVYARMSSEAQTDVQRLGK